MYSCKDKLQHTTKIIIIVTISNIIIIIALTTIKEITNDGTQTPKWKRYRRVCIALSRFSIKISAAFLQNRVIHQRKLWTESKKSSNQIWNYYLTKKNRQNGYCLNVFTQYITIKAIKSSNSKINESGI